MRPAVDQMAAKKRIRRFFDEPLAERKHVSYFIEKVSESAEVFVFGGALRDISLLGVPSFNSDVDIVVQIHDEDTFFDVLGQFDAVRNKFGGHRIRIGRWKFDVWEVGGTWAFTVGAVEARSYLSLLETTFFNWDAILYDWGTGSLHHRQNYFSDLTARYLELVLEENPNTLGALVRSLRTLCLSDEILAGPKLSRFVKEQIEAVSNEEILSYEMHSFSSKQLSNHLLQDFRARALDWSGDIQFSWLPNQQLCFFDDFLDHKAPIF